MAYGSSTGAAAMLQSVSIGAATNPTTTEVGNWVTEGAAIIDRAIAGAGYTVPVATAATCYNELVSLNNLWAAANILQSIGMDNLAGETEARSELMFKRFWEWLKNLLMSDLSTQGVPVAAPPAGRPRRRIRTLQMRKVDGYSGAFEGIDQYDNTSE